MVDEPASAAITDGGRCKRPAAIGGNGKRRRARMALYSPHQREIGRVGLPGYVDISLRIQGDTDSPAAFASSERIVEDQSVTAGAPGARNEK